MQEIHNKIISGLKAYISSSGVYKAVIGLSGGIDSSLTLKLAVEAFEPQNVYGVAMPQRGLTKNENIYHARELAKFFKINFYEVSINNFVVDYSLLPWEQSELATMNTKARIRMTILYNLANAVNALVLGTSNKSEIMLGYGTKYGDAAADILPIGALLKTQVWELSKFLNLPDEIIEKIPSAELKEGQTDEEELGASYKKLDLILNKLPATSEELINKGLDPLLVHRILRLMKLSEHKRNLPPVVGI
jgi:NAD+ synthase